MKTRRLVPFALAFLALSACKSSGGGNSGDPDAGPAADANTGGQPDADLTTPDANTGGITLQIACTNVCSKGDQCFGPGEGDCPTDCMTQLGDKCSQDEINAMDGCSSVDCGTFEECLTGIDCVTGGGGGPGECHDVCTTGANQDPTCGTCQADICASDPFCCDTEWDNICVNEAKDICGADCPSVCGDFVCDDDEDLTTCPDDCANICGNGTCEAGAGEDCASCEADCGACVCGDGTCSKGECSTCAADCPDGCTCGDVCLQGEAQDPSCGSCQADICAADPFCCETSWDGICAGEAESICGKDCPSVCGDFVCDSDEDENSCPDDCAGIDPPPPNDGGTPTPVVDAGVQP